MDPERRVGIPIAIAFAPDLEKLARAAERGGVAVKLEAQLRGLLERLGLPGEPSVTIMLGDSRLAVAIRVHGARQHYAPSLLRGAWEVTVPAALRVLPSLGAKDASGFPDTWLRQWVADVGAFDGNDDSSAVLDFVVRLGREVVAEHPSCLLSPGQAEAYLRACAPELSDEERPVVAARLLPVFASLLELGVSLADPGQVWEAIRSAEAASAWEDVAERAFVRLHAKRVAVHVPPAYLAAVAPGVPTRGVSAVDAEEVDPQLREPFAPLAEIVFREFGVRLPELVWAPSPDVPDGCIAVGINGQVGAALVALPSDDVLVNAAPDALQAIGVAARPYVDPVTQATWSAVDQGFRPRLETSYTIWSPLWAVGRAVLAEIRRRVGRLVNMEEVEYLLAQLDEYAPKLVEMVGAEYSLEVLTRTVRALVSEGFSIRNLRAILERLLEYDTVPVERTSLVVLDDRLPLREPREAGLTDPVKLASFVRLGLKAYVSFNYAKEPTSGYELSRELEALLVGQRGRPDEDLQEKVLTALWTKLGGTPSGPPDPVVLTSIAARAPLRQVIADECPRVAVLAFAELAPPAQVQVVDRIAVPPADVPVG